MARRGGSPGKVIDNLRWSGGVALFGSALGAGTAALTVLAAGVPRETIMRTRGEVTVALDSVSIPGALILVSMGMVLVPEGTGTTVVWDPFSDAEAPWFWFRETVLGYEEMVADVIDIPGLTSSRIVVDSKAMRRANVDEEAQFVITNTTLIAAKAINFGASFRFLLGS